MPVYQNRLVGREPDRARLRELLLDHGHRLVVVSGTGGVGKTRLAVQVAADLRERFRDDARFLPLASVPADTDLDAAFAWHLGLRDVQGQTHRDGIAAHLEPRETLLVVDNAEHLPALAELLTYIHGRCASVAMLVTSRGTLDIYGEVVHQLVPLAHRAADALLPAARPPEPARSDAAELFRERVRAVVPGFEITADNAAVIAAICDRLGGLPLAIELTTPRMAGRDPAALLAELEAQPAGSMRDTIRLSYDQLGEDERRVFRALCVMCGQWAIDDVLPILPPGIDELAAIDAIDALVTRSLIASPTGPGEEIRFSINPVLRHVGRELLAARGEDRAVADRHADRMVALAEAAEPELTGVGQRQWLARIEALHDDFRDAHAHLRATGRAVDALRLATALWRFAYVRGHYREVREMLETSLAGVDGEDALRCHALNGLGMLANLARDPEGSRAAYQQALALALAHDLHREIAISRIGLADIEATVARDTDGALRHLGFAAEAYARLGDGRGMASVLTNRGYIEWQLGQLDRAFATHEEARALYERARDTRGIAWSDMNTGRIAARQGRYHEAVPRLRAGLEGYLQVGDVSGVAEALEAFAAAAAGAGDRETASVLLGAGAALRERIGSAPSGLDRDERDATLAAARAGRGHEAAFARGAGMTPDEAVAMMRSIPAPAPPPETPPPGARELARERFGITPREHEVLALLAEGLTNREIAARLDVSHRTVQTHVQALLHKLDAGTRSAAVHAAHRAGIVPQHRPEP